MTEPPYAGPAARNAAPILEVLQREFRDCSRVIEIGSGTGQHAVTFAKRLDHLFWQTSDLDQNHPGIVAWLEGAGLENAGSPLSVDVRTATLDAEAYDAAFSSNTAHIMDIDAVANMFSLVGDALSSGGVFCLYGPFRVAGTFNTSSNEEFDTSLRARDPAMGIRDLEQLDDFAAAAHLDRQRLYAMPSNNYVAMWRKRVDA